MMPNDEFVKQIDLSDMTPPQVELILALLVRERHSLLIQHDNKIRELDKLIAEFEAETQ